MLKKVESILVKTVGFGIDPLYDHLIPMVEDQPGEKEHPVSGQVLFGPNAPVRMDKLTKHLEEQGYVLVNVDQRLRPGGKGHGRAPVIFRMYQRGGQLWMPAETDCHRWLNWALRRAWAGCAVYHNLRGHDSVINIDLVAPKKMNGVTEYYPVFKLLDFIMVGDNAPVV